MTDQHDVRRLEQRITELEAEQEALRGQLARAQLDQWEGRIDDLEVQLHLGAMELSDRLDPLVAALRNRWLDAQHQLSESTSTTGETLDTLRSGLEQAMRDIRDAVEDAKTVATR
jgi:chromosome segregation ATPase